MFGKANLKKMWSKLFILPLLLSSIEGKTISPRKKVCVIGAGMAGLATVKRLAEHTDEFEPIVFEKNSDVGGLWIYTDSTTVDEHGLPVHSSVYRNLRNNVPKELMAWPDYRTFNGDDESSTVPHHLVLEYLRNYTDHFELRQYIQLNTLVEHVEPVGRDHSDWQKTEWHVKTRNLNTQEQQEIVCNAVAVCNGHYTKSYIPVIPGIDEFKGPILHSHTYRIPEMFDGMTVTILGASVSGVDIAVDISAHAKKIYLSHRHEKHTSKLPSNIEQVPGVVRAKGNELILSNGTSVISDAFIYCTGYLPEFTFLDETSGIKVPRAHVYPLYKQMINAVHPSMAIIGLPSVTSTWLLPYVQSKYFVALLQGKVNLPSYEKMIEDANTLPPGARTGRYHDLEDNQWAYNEELARAGNFELPPSYYQGGLHLYNAYRTTHLANFRKVLFKFRPDGSFYLENTE